MGRLAKEKNLDFLVEAITKYFAGINPLEKCYFLLVGVGPMKQTIVDYFKYKGFHNHLRTAGLLHSQDVVNAYHAMDLFVFSSKSETQGMVITEAMAAGTPVVAIDAPGVREVVKDNVNGKLLLNPSSEDFSSTIAFMANLSQEHKNKYSREAKNTADEFSLTRSVDKALACFEDLRKHSLEHRDQDYHMWSHALNLIESEWEHLKEFTSAAEASIKSKKKSP